MQLFGFEVRRIRSGIIPRSAVPATGEEPNRQSRPATPRQETRTQAPIRREVPPTLPLATARRSTSLEPPSRRPMPPRFRYQRPRVAQDLALRWLPEVPDVVTDRVQRWRAAEQAAGMYQLAHACQGHDDPVWAARRVLREIQETVGMQQSMGEDVPDNGVRFAGQVDEWQWDQDRDDLDA